MTPCPAERARTDPGWRAHLLTLDDAAVQLRLGYLAPVRCCLLCNEPQGFVLHGPALYYDSGCSCYRSSTGSLQIRRWEDMQAYFEEGR